MEILESRKCLSCGKEFTVNALNKNKLYCSESCGYKYRIKKKWDSKFLYGD